MAKEMIVSVNGREKKIAIIDNGKVTELYIERGEENSGVVGNIYKGKVMRVLPGMQSAFVDIGLERDAFLYVSDFFDEEEELERIMVEKGKKTTSDEERNKAKDQIDRARHEREKQMDSAQEIAEPLIEVLPTEEAEGGDVVPKEGREGRRSRGRRGRGRDRDRRDAQGAVGEKDDSGAVAGTLLPELAQDDSGFERIVDESDMGEMLKDAQRQERIVDQVRLVEFDIESESEAEVGSLLDSAEISAGGFERVADEADEADDVPKAKKGKGKPKSTSTEKKSAKETASKETKEKKAPAKSKKETASKTSKTSKSKKKSDDIEDGDASVKESSDVAEMAVRRGGRGGRGRRGGKPAVANDNPTQERYETSEMSETIVVEDEIAEAELSPVEETAEKTDKKGARGGRGGRDRRDRPQQTITDLLKEGQEIIVQIAKEPIAKKGARITSHIALPGRYLVYMPTIEHLGVSRKIESAAERSRLRTFIQKIKQEENVPTGGFIVRTAGIGIPEANLRDDALYLVKTWQDIKKNSEKRKSPLLVHQDLDIIQRLLRDHLSDDFAAIRVDNEEEYLRTVDFVSRIQPKMVNRVKLYTREEPILEAYGVQDEIEKALKPRVWLKSGGYLVINQTEALIAIDVNTGKFVGKGNARLEDTITKTNMEAVEEIARQIRLRDLGGIIVLDLIDMEDRKNRQKVLSALQDHLQRDKSPTKVLSFNDFGLIIMTRKRVKQSLERTLCAPCEYCQGSGWVKSPQTVCFEILDEARRLSRSTKEAKHITLRVHPEVAKALRSTERVALEEIEAYLGAIDVTSDKTIHQGQFDFAFV
jgi:ribonuclease G